MEFKDIIIKWYIANKRDLPWRNTLNPYYIWVSEVILQQTRVNQGLDYYLRFINTFPTIKELADAPIDKVMKIWQGLGYYSRARNLQKGAQQVLYQFNGELPKSFDELLRIKGIGPYSAGAIASFAFKQPVPAIDGNVYRVLARVFGVFASTETSMGKKEFFGLVMELIDKKKPDIFNQALLDFGALQCTPHSPVCNKCPFSTICFAFRNNMVNQLPVKGKKIKTRDRFFNYLLLRKGDKTFIRKRVGNDIWNSLYEFPLIETLELIDFEKLLFTDEWKELIGKGKASIMSVSEPVKHILSHQTIYSRFIIIEIKTTSYNLKNNFVEIPINEINEYSIPRLIDSYMAAEPVEKYFLSK
jgi:A/G-specific adenine glycosylase